ncbi:MAG TPA: hypothetical protein VHI52_03860, partial [Verrucomicrobiae bacterium]|nr:hypothetical protein [Verrucomicrobiae bacterium]
LLMIRLYARELHDADKAYALIEKLTQRAWLPPGLLDYLRHMAAQWLRPPSPAQDSKVGVESLLVHRKPAPPETENPAEEQASSVADLLTSGRLGTAIEILEKRVSQRSGDFEACLMLAEAHGRYCCNIDRARDIVRQIEANPIFTAEQIRQAKAKLQQWQERLSGNFAMR